jgi:hypothetical protein
MFLSRYIHTQVWRSWQCRPPAAQTNGNIPRAQEQEPVAAVITTTHTHTQHIQTRKRENGFSPVLYVIPNRERKKKTEIRQSSGLIGSVGIFSFVFLLRNVCVVSPVERENHHKSKEAGNRVTRKENFPIKKTKKKKKIINKYLKERDSTRDPAGYKHIAKLFLYSPFLFI